MIFLFILSFLLLWGCLAIPNWNKRFEMDWGYRNPGSFFAPFAIYRRMAWTIFALSLPQAGAWAYAKSGFLASLLLMAAILAFLFNFWLTFCYEEYLHSKYVNADAVRLGVVVTNYSSYVGWKYALTLALGLYSLFLFVVGTIASVGALAELR